MLKPTVPKSSLSLYFYPTLYLLSIAGQEGSWWVWQSACTLSMPCLQLFPPVCFQTIAEGVADLAVLLRLVDVDVALRSCWPGISEEAVVLSLSALGL